MLDWYDKLKDSTKSYLYNNGEDKILNLIETSTNDNTAFVSRLAKGIVGLRIEDWNDKSIIEFIDGLKKFKDVVETQDRKDSSNSSNSYTLTFKEQDGNVATKSFEKCEYSNRAKLTRENV